MKTVRDHFARSEPTSDPMNRRSTIQSDFRRMDRQAHRRLFLLLTTQAATHRGICSLLNRITTINAGRTVQTLCWLYFIGLQKQHAQLECGGSQSSVDQLPTRRTSAMRTVIVLGVAAFALSGL